MNITKGYEEVEKYITIYGVLCIYHIRVYTLYHTSNIRINTKKKNNTTLIWNKGTHISALVSIHYFCMLYEFYPHFYLSIALVMV